MDINTHVLLHAGDGMSQGEAEYVLQQFYPDISAKHLKELTKDGISLDMLQQLLVEQLPQVRWFPTYGCMAAIKINSMTALMGQSVMQRPIANSG